MVVFVVENQSMIIACNESKQEYVIPTYYVREHDNNSVLIDTSVIYLNNYPIGRNDVVENI